MIAEGSVAGVMEGRKYNRGVRLHKLLYEALMRQTWKGFLYWLETTHMNDMVHLDETLKAIDSLGDSHFEGGPREQLLCTHHRTVWNLPRVPQSWKRQPLKLLDVLFGHG